MEYQAEFELKTNEKVIYEFISTPGGLQQWMADDVKVFDSDFFEFTMDDESYRVKVVSKKINSFVRFEFIDLEDEQGEMPYLELRLEVNDLTQVLYLVVKDATTLVDSNEDCYDIWEALVGDLKDIIGA